MIKILYHKKERLKMKKRLISLFLMSAIVFCSGSIVVKGILGNSQNSNRPLIADPINIEPEVINPVNG